jgi:hypothetical protein
MRTWGSVSADVRICQDGHLLAFHTIVKRKRKEGKFVRVIFAIVDVEHVVTLGNLKVSQNSTPSPLQTACVSPTEHVPCIHTRV